MRRFFINQPVIETGSVCRLGESDARHIRDVLRLRPGTAIRLFNNTGYQYNARITDVWAEGVDATVTEVLSGQNESPTRITVIQAFLKNKKMDTLVRQLTELGMAAWRPVFTEHAVVNPDPERLPARVSRWETIAKEAVKQCERDRIPEILPPVLLDEALAEIRPQDANLIFTARDGRPLAAAAAEMPEASAVTILLGPEGGFTAEEIARAESRGFVTVCLGPRILKADTACLAACALTQSVFGDMGAGR